MNIARKLLAPTLLLIAVSAHAEIQGQFEEMANCMAQVDQNYLDQLGKQAEAVDEEMEQLCAAGERDAAQAKAENHARKLMADREYQKVMECTSIAGMDMGGVDYAADDDGHVCDEF